MAIEIRSFESNHKKFGYKAFNEQSIEEINGGYFRSFIKVLWLPANYSLTVDFKLYEVHQPTLFFINTNQYLNISKATDESARLLYYNRDFYCVQIHDEEVACDGLLFNNIFEIPKVDLAGIESATIDSLFLNIKNELDTQDSSAEEMIRIYLKQIIIRATREWKRQNLQNEKINLPVNETGFFRDYSRLVEIHFREKHSVADYAALLNMAPKTLSSKFHKHGLDNPNEIIKNRIILEAKRLLTFTQLSIKEIAYQLGYEDPAYFNRTFTQKTALTPAGFRKTAN